MRTLWLTSGLVIGFTLGFSFRDTYRNSNQAQIVACTKYYLSNLDTTDPELIAKAKKEGFKDVQTLVQHRCEEWVRRGDKF